MSEAVRSPGNPGGAPRGSRRSGDHGLAPMGGGPAAATSLPVPGRARWQPLRVGLVDLFYYDVEEFRFRDGRLLLRGNNGTGKSKVLALTLPFLLDGDLSPHRVEPDADPKKRMEWNLLLGGEHPHPERLGYTWLEFGRLDEDGAAHVPHARLRAEGGQRAGHRPALVLRHRPAGRRRRSGCVDATGTALSATGWPRRSARTGEVYDRRAPTAGRSTRRCSASASSATPPWSTCWSSCASRSCPSARASSALPRR